MKKMNRIGILASVLALAITLAGCGQTPAAPAGSGSPASGAPAGSVQQMASGGVLRLKVNPEIAVTYDAAGLVTAVDSRNEDAKKILETYTGFEGKECRQVVSELVAVIGQAGYFVEEVEGQSRQITIEIESGSSLPSQTFLDDVVADVRTTVSSNDWTSPVEVKGGSDYGITNYVDTDYGPNSDGVTDYDDTDYGPGNDGITDYDHNSDDGTDYGEGSDGVTDYDNDDGTDYGPNGDGVTDYDDTDYGPNSDGVTDYDDTDYGPNSDGVTDYDDTDYGPNSDGVTNYDDTDYGPNSDGVTNYDDTDYGPNNDGVTDYNSGSTNYDSGSSNYDSGSSNYDDSGSSDYDN